jgi:hypothetical protein
MPRWIDFMLILCGGILGAAMAHVKTTAEVNVVGTAWSLTLIPGLLFIAPLGGVHGFLAEVIWPVIIACNALAYALIVSLFLFLVRRLFTH